MRFISKWVFYGDREELNFSAKRQQTLPGNKTTPTWHVCTLGIYLHPSHELPLDSVVIQASGGNIERTANLQKLCGVCGTICAAEMEAALAEAAFRSNALSKSTPWQPQRIHSRI